MVFTAGPDREQKKMDLMPKVRKYQLLSKALLEIDVWIGVSLERVASSSLQGRGGERRGGLARRCGPRTRAGISTEGKAWVTLLLLLQTPGGEETILKRSVWSCSRILYLLCLHIRILVGSLVG